MTTKTITWVSDIGEPTDRGVRYINVAFLDKDTAYIGKKNIDTAVEVHGLLTEALNKEIEFTLEESGTNKHGGTKFKIKAFGEYQPAPFVPGGGATASTNGRERSRSPEQPDGIRRAVALKAAAQCVVGTTPEDVLRFADAFEAWLAKTSGSTSSEQKSPLPQAGVGSESTSPAAGPAGATAGVATKGEQGGRGVADLPPSSPAGDNRGGQSAYGEGVGCPPHDLDLDVQPKAQRFPCRRCKAWIKPSMNAEEVPAE